MQSTALAFTFLLGEFRAHGKRAVIGVMAIAIGVAMGYTVHLINYAASSEFSQAVRSIMGTADLAVRGRRFGFSEQIYPLVAQLPEVAVASPVIEIDAHIPQQTEALKIIGIDYFRALSVQPNMLGHLADDNTNEASVSFSAFHADALFLSPAALTWLKLKAGDKLAVQVGMEIRTLQIVGTVPAAGAGQRIGVMDIAAAQWRFDRLGLLQRIDLKLRPGVNIATFKDKLATLLPAGVAAVTPDDSARRAANLSRAYRVNLNVLALVALFTGAFLVFSTQVLSVLRRRSQLALLRVLGLTRASLLRWMLAEGAVIGALGASLGLALGYMIASAVLDYSGADLGGGYFSGIRPTVHFDAWAASIFFALGLGAALIGSLIPALETARTQPSRALKAGDEETSLQRLRSPLPALVLIAIGVALCFAGPVNELPIPGYIAIALLLIGSIALMPRCAHAVFSRLPIPTKIAPYLAVTQLQGASGRASIGLSGILASFSLMAAMAIMVTSFRVSVDEWLGDMLPAELYMRAAPSGDTAYFSAQDQLAILNTAGIARAEFLRSTQITLDPLRPAITLIARPIDPANPAARLPFIGTVLPATVENSSQTITVWASEAAADLHGLTVGKQFILPLGKHGQAVVIGGIWRDYARQHGAIVINLADYRRLTGDERITEVGMWLQQNATTTQVSKNLNDTLRNLTRLEIAEPGEVRSASLKIFDRSFTVTYLLEAVAIIVGLFGIAASFGGQALARAREFGMLRHIGVTRRQIGLMLALEGALLTTLGVVAGLALGWVIALILVHVVNPQSFHWSMNMHMPWGLLASVATTLIITAAITALLSGRSAMSMQAVRAVRDDW